MPYLILFFLNYFKLMEFIYPPEPNFITNANSYSLLYNGVILMDAFW